MPHYFSLPVGPFYSWQLLVTFGGGLLLLVGGVIWMVTSSLCEEVSAPLEEWRSQHPPLTNQKQKPAVRASIARLSSPRRYVRVEGLQLLAQFNDVSCVPALLRVIEMYPDDAPFLMDVVSLLMQLGDERALPALHKLSANHHYALIQAAQQAVRVIEPRSVLLRAGAAPADAGSALLRAAMPSALNAMPATLLRAGAMPDKEQPANVSAL